MFTSTLNIDFSPFIHFFLSPRVEHRFRLDEIRDEFFLNLTHVFPRFDTAWIRGGGEEKFFIQWNENPDFSHFHSIHLPDLYTHRRNSLSLDFSRGGLNVLGFRKLIHSPETSAAKCTASYWKICLSTLDKFTVMNDGKKFADKQLSINRVSVFIRFIRKT